MPEPVKPAPAEPPVPIVSKHEMLGLPSHWDVSYPCCGALLDTFYRRQDACQAADSHKCDPSEAQPFAETAIAADPLDEPGVDLAAVRKNYERAAATYPAAEAFVAEHLRKRHGARKAASDHIEALQAVVESVPAMIAALERVKAMAEAMAGRQDVHYSGAAVADALIANLNLKEKIA